MDLYLVRHAVAFKRDRGRWSDDADRPLTPEGEEDFRVVAGELGRIVPGVELVLSSPYARAWRTAEILNEETTWPIPRVFSALEPEIPPHKILTALATYAEAETLALVGHRPSLHELAAYLLVGDEDTLNIGLKKGGAACIRFKGPPGPGGGKLRWLLTPQILGSMRGV
ncbi:MAG: phosphohistidine phosphatase SixA [Rubrobacteraceae bacterium]